MYLKKRLQNNRKEVELFQGFQFNNNPDNQPQIEISIISQPKQKIELFYGGKQDKNSEL